MLDSARLLNAYQIARDRLLAERTAEGYWVGELSASALSTATAIAALALFDRTSGTAPKHTTLIEKGQRWLVEHQNPDGGWGDTVKSFSNISTTMLCRAAFHIAKAWPNDSESCRRCEAWLRERYGDTPERLAEAVRNRYGKDRTFSVPILMMCALAGLIEWREVPRLPFEAACLPQSWYRLARMPVVSYALPALIAIGQIVHHNRSTWNPITLFSRWLGKRRSLRVLERIQPTSGGYLEATPLTSFVAMSLAAMKRDRAIHSAAERVLSRCVQFIINSVRPDGSWPIDSNLSIWVTTLSVNALATADDFGQLERREELQHWLLEQQTKEIHPYTGAAPGAWGWSHLPGSVPDCDDTPGALIALRTLAGEEAPKQIDQFIRHAMSEVTFVGTKTKLPEASGNVGFHALHGLAWIRDLANRNGGWPTFCRGWGKLPFDRSGSDLTAHALRAITTWGQPSTAAAVVGIIEKHMALNVRAGRTRVRFFSRQDYHHAIDRGFAYLAANQRPDGSWLPLWFGNQHAPDDINPVYGTSRVLAAYRDLSRADCDEAQRGIRFLLDVQNPDGGWGGAKATPSSVEETAVAVEVLIELAPADAIDAIQRGIDYLVRRVEDGTFIEPSPIGFYFAKLWYFEKLYPIIFTVAALGRAIRRWPKETSK